MFDPFASALVALFSAPGSDAAVYTPPGGGNPISLRVIVSRPSASRRFGSGEMIMDENRIEIMKSDVPLPTAGALVELKDEEGVTTASLRLVGEALPDVERLSWAIGFEEV
jgi:hypothetical protein